MKSLKKLGVPEEKIHLIASFHQDMKAKIRLDGTMLEEIEVQNGLRQGYCMAPVLFNLYTCLAVERWLVRVEDTEGVGITIKYKQNKKLFRRCTKNACERKITECQFAADAALLSSSRTGAETAAMKYQLTNRDFGLTVSIPKTKHIVTGRLVEENDRTSVALEGGDFQMVDEFSYLGSVITSSGRMTVEVDKRVGQASRALGALRKAVFIDKHLKITTKRKIYNACVMSVLLYGAECWVLLNKQEKKLNTFHHRCIRSILGISNRKQWSEHITMVEVRRRWGDEETASEKVKKERLEWLGHLARNSDHRMPKSTLFGWLPQPRDRCGPKKRWRDMMRRDIKDIEISEEEWYDEAVRSRAGWSTLCRDVLERWRERMGARAPMAVRDVMCEVCSRNFRRQSD